MRQGSRKWRPVTEAAGHLIAEAYGWDPATVSAGSSKKLSWRCSKNGDHIWEATPANRIGNRSGCPYCANRKLLRGFNDLLTCHPDLAREAHGWDPSMVLGGGTSRREWRCTKCEFIWHAQVNNRINGSGCPSCAGKVVQAGTNDLATQRPLLAAEADGWDPTQVSIHSGKKLAWRCSQDPSHRWTAVVASRSDGRGCPFCYRNADAHSVQFVINTGASLGEVPLSIARPDLAQQADGWDPGQTPMSSKASLSWRCVTDHRHSWQTSLKNRLAGHGCPVCAGRKVVPGINDLATTHPHLVDGILEGDPSEVSFGSNKTFRWRCKKDARHEWNATVASVARGSGCPVCRGLKCIAGVNDLATTHPALAEEADGWDPTTLTAGSARRLSWSCQRCQSAWIASVNSRSQGSRCPVCAGQRVKSGHNDLQHTHPELAREAVGWDPTTVSAGSNAKRTWRCTDDDRHVWEATVKNRVKGAGCPICDNKLIVPGINDIQTTHPEVAATAFGWDPTRISHGSKRMLTWQCSEDPRHIWHMTANSRTSGQGCAVCAGSQVIAGVNDLLTVSPELAEQLLEPNPATVAAFSGKVGLWKCTKDSRHTWKATIASRSTGTGCPVCHGLLVIPGVNDLSTLNPDLAAQADGWDPSTVSIGSKKRLRWRCDVVPAHVWIASVGDRSRHGCPSCSSAGFNPSLKGHLYLVRGDLWLKYGITNTKGKRMQVHATGKAKMSRLLDLLSSNDGWQILEAERAIKAAIAKAGIPTAADLGYEFDGKTETIRATDVRNAATLRDLVLFLELDSFPIDL